MLREQMSKDSALPLPLPLRVSVSVSALSFVRLLFFFFETTGLFPFEWRPPQGPHPPGKAYWYDNSSLLTGMPLPLPHCGLLVSHYLSV